MVQMVKYFSILRLQFAVIVSAYIEFNHFVLVDNLLSKNPKITI